MTPTQEKLLWRETFRVRSYEIDSKGKLSIQSLANYLMEAAFNHSYALQVSVIHLNRQGITWVLSRLHIQVERYPDWMDTVIVETWPSDKNDSFALRDFLVKDKAGRVIATATTSWMIMDIQTRRPVSIPEALGDLVYKEKDRAMNDNFDALPQLEEFQIKKEFNVRLSDLDLNQHVNFLNYIEWAIESVPPEIWKQYILKDLQVSYRAEAKLGDRVVVFSEQKNEKENKEFVHSILRANDNRELTRLTSCWKSK
ncbi:MAG TPA: hypothetical protein ENK44_12320 [Caldithrix abyssi]|uniref:Acyl-ACP thioesterase n=1 Tax=Caldithrix abyssi TaxID=187145 RepID=A0A7V4U1U5_CALAY|nr:hypothetical protein [Caldithrix abyssi]